MYICSHNHEEICYESRSCPMCELIAENSELESKVESLESEIDNLNLNIEDLQSEINEQ